MTIERVIAKRYGRALFELSLEIGRSSAVLSDLSRLVEVTKRVPMFVKILSDYRVSDEKKIAILSAVVSSLKMDESVANTLRLLLRKNRVTLIPMIAADCIARIEHFNKLAISSLTVPDASVSETMKNQIEEVITRVLGLKSRCDVSINANLIGGFTVKLGSVRYDTSVRGKIERMKEELWKSVSTK